MASGPSVSDVVGILRLRLKDSKILGEGTGRGGRVILVLRAALRTPVTDERDGKYLCCETAGIGERDSCGYPAMRSRL